MRPTRRLIATMAAANALLLGALVYSLTTGPAPMPTTPCPSEDSGTNCYWDAAQQGNRQGNSFWVTQDGVAHYFAPVSAR